MKTDIFRNVQKTCFYSIQNYTISMKEKSGRTVQTAYVLKIRT